ncbi:MAG: retropepsin-like domain-containing protein [Deltaproteobacteria bacterium]|nr:retropepsin-like domain-containing protein [Deltaproteobacteria bacterium]
MKLDLVGRLIFASGTIAYRGKSVQIDNLLIDTGSGGTVLSADTVEDIDLVPEPADRFRQIVGVGGAEFVYDKKIDRICVGELEATDFTVEIGAVDYGFGINGIIGLDFLMATKAVIDLGNLSLSSER